MALGVTSNEVYGHAIEYDPQPPFDCGSPDKAPQSIHNALEDLARGLVPAS